MCIIFHIHGRQRVSKKRRKRNTFAALFCDSQQFAFLNKISCAIALNLFFCCEKNVYIWNKKNWKRFLKKKELMCFFSFKALTDMRTIERAMNYRKKLFLFFNFSASKKQVLLLKKIIYWRDFYEDLQAVFWTKVGQDIE
jgi:hypothetical protein